MLKKLLPLDPRLPKWDYSALEFRKCPICGLGNSTIAHIRPDSLQVCACNNCSTLYINPAPNSKQLSKFYEHYYENHVDPSRSSVEKFAYETRLIHPMSDTRIDRLIKLDIPTKNQKYALDVGCGRGQFLFLLKKIGFTVEGIEPDISTQKYSSKLGINSIFPGYIEQFQSNKKYDLITLLDLIEHPLDPISLISSALKHLTPGGHLLIWTPNGAPNHDELKNMTFRVDLEHMQYLTKISSQHIADIFNLKIVHLETLGVHEGFESINHAQHPNKKNISKRKFKLKIKKLITRMPGWYSFIAPMLHKADQENVKNILVSKNYHLLCIFQKPMQA